MRFVVFGGSGFIGSRIITNLASSTKNECIAISSKDCDLRDPVNTNKFLYKILPDAMVIYAAGIPRLRSNNFASFAYNTRMIHNLINSFQEAPPRSVIFLSTMEVYGIPQELPIREETPVRPETLYGIGKAAAELMLQQWQRRSGTPLAILRLPGVYGPGDNGKGFIDALIQAVKTGKEFTLYGGGIERRDFVFVNDIARVIESLTKTPFNFLNSSKARPVPRATQVSGSSAMETGSPVA